MTDFKIQLIKSEKIYDITSISSALTWKSSIDTLGAQLDVTLATSSDRFFPSVRATLGDKIILTKGTYEIFRGIITDESIGDNLSRSFIAFDFAFYLNKSKTIIQFNDIRADKAIEKLCASVNVPLDTIPKIPTKVSGIYKDKSISEILFEILKKGEEELSVRYYIEMIGEKLSIATTSRDVMNLNQNSMGVLSISRSIVDLKNSVKIRAKDSNAREITHTEKDLASIVKFGLIEEIESVDSDDISKIRNITRNKLKKKNKITENLSLTLLGDVKIRSGISIYIKDKIKSIEGIYLIKECSHKVDAGLHEMSLSVEVVD